MSRFDEQEDPVPQEVRNHFVAIRDKTERSSSAIADFSTGQPQHFQYIQGLQIKTQDNLRTL